MALSWLHSHAFVDPQICLSPRLLNPHLRHPKAWAGGGRNPSGQFRGACPSDTFDARPSCAETSQLGASKDQGDLFTKKKRPFSSVFWSSAHLPGKGRKRQKKGEKGRFRPISRKGGQTPLTPPIGGPPQSSISVNLEGSRNPWVIKFQGSRFVTL